MAMYAIVSTLFEICTSCYWDVRVVICSKTLVCEKRYWLQGMEWIFFDFSIYEGNGAGVIANLKGLIMSS